MKKLINLSVAAVIAVGLMTSISAKAMTANFDNAKADTTADPKKQPGEIDLDKHPEIMAKVRKNIKNGKIAFTPRMESSDTTLDLSKHPELVKAIIKNPANWPVILKGYNTGTDSLSEPGRKRQVIRDIIAYLVREHIENGRAAIDSFLLTDTEFVINGKKLTDKQHDFLKKQYIPEPGYIIYYGNDKMTGKGIFQRTDNL